MCWIFRLPFCDVIFGELSVFDFVLGLPTGALAKTGFETSVAPSVSSTKEEEAVIARIRNYRRRPTCRFPAQS